ncbi:MAG: TIGR04283 family arsenosugar biosynthesis glycosyltransferase [Peptostreptococcus sp.]|uniref:TIGR04283 family arsenosugar biosynthesis glycosyltransferase n=1 Tax=Peptostreptococcus sp. TaxID=1262 RepID=UPI002FCC052A
MYKKISIIIPIYNEFENVKKIINNLKDVEDIYEVIFSDGSNDYKSKREIIEANKKYNSNIFKYIESSKGRAVQMNTGYKYSCGDIILFLHCDSIVENDLSLKIISSINENKVEFGCLSLYFDDKRLLMKICGYMSRKRAERRKIAFGDQGMFFRKETFELIGMFPEIALMEDYEASIRAKKYTNLKQINSKIITSSRKYYSNKGIFNKGKLSFIGILKTMLDMQIFQYQYRRGVSPDKLLEKYYKK